MSLLLALQTPLDITGSGTSALLLTDAGSALEIFIGSDGAGAFTLSDAGTALEVFIAVGAPSFGFTDIGDALETFIGTGAPSFNALDTGTGTVEGGAEPEPPPNGGGWTYRDRTREKTVRAFRRILQPSPPERRARPAAKEQAEIFAYVSESEFSVVGAGGRGGISLTRGAGTSVTLMKSRGQGRIEESAADIIRLLLSIEEL